MIVWGDDKNNDTREARADDQAFTNAVLTVAAVLLYGYICLVAVPAAFDQEMANDEAQARRHRARVERLAPQPYPYAFETKVFDLQQLAAPEVR